MPIMGRYFMLAVVMSAALPCAALAQGRVIVDYAYQLEDAPAVRKQRVDYNALASAYVLSTTCATEMNFTKEKQDFVQVKFSDVATAYQRAYIEAYTSYVGSPPKKPFVDDVTKRMTDEQQKSVNNMALLIRDKGCRTHETVEMRKYVDGLMQQEVKKDEPPPAARAPKVRF